MSWNNNPIRRGQLIMPFGPGSLFVSKDGTSMMIAGIDHWFDDKKIEKEEFILNDWRLEIEMDVKEFRLPPDFRSSYPGGSEINTKLNIPALRFPQYHICSNCKLMQKKPLEQAQFVTCRNCEPKKAKHKLNQARFLSICQKGHIQDFPWREWVHKSGDQKCNGNLYYNSGQGAGMDSISISCGNKDDKNGCGSRENLSSAVLKASKNEHGEINSSSLKDLIKNIDYRCKGMKPWLGDSEGCECNSPPIAALRGAGNVYFGITRSSLSLPKSDDVLIQSICDEITKNTSLSNIIETPRAFLSVFNDSKREEDEANYKKYLEQSAEDLADKLVCADLNKLEPIILAINLLLYDQKPEELKLPQNRDLREVAFRRQEYEILQKDSFHEDLIVEVADMKDYKSNEIYSSLLEGIDHISLVKKLVETTAFEGFTRFNPSFKEENKSDLMLEKNKNLINWLPARQSTGEGIFIRFNEKILSDWEKKPEVLDRVSNLDSNIAVSQLFNNQALGSPRHVLIHSFAHALINELTYSSGYSSSALRERLYVSDDPKDPMAGVLVYTASGDSEGSMGGLVMQGRPKTFEDLLLRTLTKSSWCSHDPVCAIGKDTGPDSCNNSACYSCCLVPEPSCEFSNAGLDRALLGTRALGYKDVAYFIPLEEKET